MRRITGRPAFAPELLEGRALLSHFKPSITVAAEIHASAAASTKTVSVITGHIKGFAAPDPLGSPTPPGYQGFSGHGPTASIGPAFLGIQHQSVSSPSPNTSNLINGSGVLTTLYGENVDLKYTGVSIAKNAGQSSVFITGTVVSGTGQFDGETGTLQATGTGFRSGRFALSYAIYLTPRTA